MNWIQEYKQKFSLKTFRRKSKKVSFPHDFVDLDRAASVGFIINIGLCTPKDLIVLTDYITKLEEHGKKVFMVEINFLRKSEPMFNETNKSIFINPSHISWLGFPSREVLKEINANQADILLNLDTSEGLTSHYISGMANARTRAGLYEEELMDFYELMLELPRDTKLKTLLSSFEEYLKMIEK
ncbi:MAG: hypothetical protein H6581_11325 [Bacteroidia bacterium]|nr:hypothetical protein [Bacteroidia bacterium]